MLEGFFLSTFPLPCPKIKCLKMYFYGNKINKGRHGRGNE